MASQKARRRRPAAKYRPAFARTPTLRARHRSPAHRPLTGAFLERRRRHDGDGKPTGPEPGQSVSGSLSGSSSGPGPPAPPSGSRAEA